MTAIKKYVDQIDEELNDAKEYAECALMHKAKGNSMLYSRYKEMAEDEVKHSNYLHQIAVDAIEELKAVYKPTQQMQDVWDHSHADYVERAAWIKQMLSM